MGVRGQAAARGRLVAAALRGSWRVTPPPPELTVAQLESISPLLVRTGSAGLAWRVISPDAALAGSNAGHQLRSAWLLEVGRAAARQQHLLEVLERTRSEGLDPVLLKGWSVERRYPGPGLRPSSDIDLCLPARQVTRAERAVSDIAVAVDFDHREELEGTTLEALFDRSVVIELEHQPVRVPGPADELRILCLHFLKHGGWRPLWLCDLALVCEQSPESAEHAVSGGGRLPEYVRAALGSAHQLLSADCAVDTRLPHWVGATIQREWGSSRVTRAHGPLAPLRPVRRFVRDLPGRFPNPVAATVSTGAPMTGLPRALVQVAAIADSGCRFLLHQRTTDG